MYKGKKRENELLSKNKAAPISCISESKLKMSEGKNLRRTVDHCRDTIQCTKYSVGQTLWLVRALGMNSISILSEYWFYLFLSFNNIAFVCMCMRVQYSALFWFFVALLYATRVILLRLVQNNLHLYTILDNKFIGLKEFQGPDDGRRKPIVVGFPLGNLRNAKYSQAAKRNY